MHVWMYVFTDVGMHSVCVGVCMDIRMYACLDAHVLRTNRTSLVDGAGHLSHAIRHHLQAKTASGQHVCVCVCVCARARGTHTHTEREIYA